MAEYGTRRMFLTDVLIYKWAQPCRRKELNMTIEGSTITRTFAKLLFWIRKRENV